MIFLLIVGFLFDSQPLYTSVDVDDPDAAATECYFAGDPSPVTHHYDRSTDQSFHVRFTFLCTSDYSAHSSTDTGLFSFHSHAVMKIVV